MLNARHIRRRFERAAGRFDEADFVHAATRTGLLARLEPLLLEARTIVDLGTATGAANRLLEKRFRPAQLIAVDLAHNMLHEARAKKAWLSKTRCIQADANALPLANESVDAVFSNMLLPFVSDPSKVFAEVARVMRKGGLFAFATLGPDSLRELRLAWAAVDNGVHVNPFADMHNIGDALLHAGLSDPVLDVDRLRVRYQDSTRLFADLTSTGARNSLLHRHPGLTGRRRFADMLAALGGGAKNGTIELDLELVYGHCWGAGPKMPPGNYAVDANRIKVRGT